MFGGLGFPELLIIFLVALLFFGAKRLPDLAGGLGKSIRELKKGLKDDQDEALKEIHQTSPDEPPKGNDKAAPSS
ncbi:MAG: twin-arginine translocase TatA/TatE family subunit [Candidatus Latescibacteria bacterium]|nr:twin-arginine translocase TatA/TatE family subunit [Candidatus Latescibacterota bacterium]